MSEKVKMAIPGNDYVATCPVRTCGASLVNTGDCASGRGAACGVYLVSKVFVRVQHPDVALLAVGCLAVGGGCIHTQAAPLGPQIVDCRRPLESIPQQADNACHHY